MAREWWGPCPESHGARSWPPGWLYSQSYRAEGPCLSWRQMPTQPRALVPAPAPSEAHMEASGLPQHWWGPEARCICCPRSALDPSLRSALTSPRFPLWLDMLTSTVRNTSCFSKAAWVLVLCLGSVPGTSELCRASRKVAYVCTPFSLLSLEGPALDLLELQEKSFVFSLSIFASTRAASFWIYECQRFFFSFLIAHQIFSSKNAVLINLMNLPCVFWTQVSMRVMVMAFWKNLLKNMSPYNKFLQRVHFHIKILSAAVFFYTLQPLAVVLQSPEATVLKTWAWLLFGLFSFWPP